MSDFNIRSDSVNVEQIMQQIRARIREKRGVDYTEQQIRELASVKLERFLDPKKVRSELLQQFRDGSPPTPLNYAFEDTTLYESHRWAVRWVRRLLNPVLKLFFNPNTIVHVLHLQAELNQREAQVGELTFELLHNLVVEITRLGIEVKNLKMRVESVSSRFDFAERRARALEGVVQYRPGAEPTGPESSTPGPAAPGPTREADQAASAEGRRRRRRRRGRRSAGRPTGEDTSATGQPGGGPPAEAPGDRGPAEPASGGTEPAAQREAPAPPDREDP